MKRWSSQDGGFSLQEGLGPGLPVELGLGAALREGGAMEPILTAQIGQADTPPRPLQFALNLYQATSNSFFLKILLPIFQ